MSDRLRQGDSGPLQKESAKLRDMSDFMAHQLTGFIDGYEGKFDPTELSRFNEFSSEYLSSRIARGQELTSEKINQALELKEQFHGQNDHFFFVTCIDGRNIPTIMFSYVPRLGGFLRTRAGDIFEFEELMNDDELRINPSTAIYQKIEALLVDRPGQNVFYGLDSHFSCAAREGISTQSGSMRRDKGLRDDVIRKIKIGRAVTQIRNRLINEGRDVANVFPDLFSYNPETGTMVVGLERMVDDPIFASEDFDLHAGIEELARQGKIIDTWQLLQEDTIATLLSSHVRPVDFRTDYAAGLLSNWQAITDLYDNGKGELFITIRKRVADLYDDEIPADHIDHKAKIILKNLVTRWSQAENKATIEYAEDGVAKQKSAWPFAEHKERTIVISERVFGPFESIEKFVVTPATVAGDDEMLDNAKTGLHLVRRFRPEAEKRMPILIDSQIIVRAFNGLPPDQREAQWEMIRNIDFSFLSDINWDDPTINNWTIQDISNLWRRQLDMQDVSSGRVTMEVKYFIWEAFSRMRSFLKDKDFRSQLKKGEIILMHTIVNRDGKPEIILPIYPWQKSGDRTLVA